MLAVCYASFARSTASRQRLHRQNRHLEDLSQRDGLTGIPNRRAFDLRLQELWTDDPTPPLSLLMIDMDSFKAYNDRFGHIAGDAALQACARLLQAGALIHDGALVARYGGEEFCALLPGATEEIARKVGEHLRHLVAAADWAGQPITVSVGAATRTLTLSESKHLLHGADLALYYAKHTGRNRLAHASDLIK